MESLIAGIPVVAIGPQHGNPWYFENHNLYEIPSFIRNGETGFISDDINELRSYITELFNNDQLASEISQRGRAEAIKHFGKDMIKASWKAYLEK
jgi:glycosyltransferase involved in cell wall biosynthesis